jgi:hypothetical protein
MARDSPPPKIYTTEKKITANQIAAHHEGFEKQ